MAQAPVDTKKPNPPADKPSDKPASTGTPAGTSTEPAATAAATPANGTPAAKPGEGGNGNGAGGSTPPAAAAKNKNPNKLFVVVGEIHEFETSAKAEKFLNGEGAPTSFTVLRGKRISQRAKVSLR
jgi:hypothetical protein